MKFKPHKKLTPKRLQKRLRKIERKRLKARYRNVSIICTGGDPLSHSEVRKLIQAINNEISNDIRLMAGVGGTMTISDNEPIESFTDADFY